MSAINIFANEIAVSVVLVSALLFMTQKLLRTLLHKIVFVAIVFIALLVPFIDFSVSGYVYALLGSPSVLLIIASLWSMWQVLRGGKKFESFFNIRAKVLIFVACGIIYFEFLGGIFSISRLLFGLCGFSIEWLDFYHLDSAVQVAALWIFAVFSYFFISVRLGVSLVCALFAYKILGDMPVWDYCFDPFLWLWCGVSALYVLIVEKQKAKK